MIMDMHTDTITGMGMSIIIEMKPIIQSEQAEASRLPLPPRSGGEGSGVGGDKSSFSKNAPHP